MSVVRTTHQKTVTGSQHGKQRKSLCHGPVEQGPVRELVPLSRCSVEEVQSFVSTRRMLWSEEFLGKPPAVERLWQLSDRILASPPQHNERKVRTPTDRRDPLLVELLTTAIVKKQLSR